MSEETRGCVQLSQGGHTEWSDDAAVALLDAQGYGAPVEHDTVLLYDDTEVVAVGRNGALNTCAWAGFFQTRVFLNNEWRLMHFRADGSHWIDLTEA